MLGSRKYKSSLYQSIYLANCATTVQQQKWMSTKQCKAQWRATRKANRSSQLVAQISSRLAVEFTCKRSEPCRMVRRAASKVRAASTRGRCSRSSVEACRSWWRRGAPGDRGCHAVTSSRAGTLLSTRPLSPARSRTAQPHPICNFNTENRCNQLRHVSRQSELDCCWQPNL